MNKQNWLKNLENSLKLHLMLALIGIIFLLVPQVSNAQIVISSGSGFTPVTSGGTGLGTLTAHGVVIGEGTSAVAIVSGGTNCVLFWTLSSSDPTCSASPTLTSPTVTSLSINSSSLIGGSSANILELRNGTSPQTYNIYGTFTDVSNYQRLRVVTGQTINSVAGSSLFISEAAGTGSAGELNFQASKIRLGDTSGTAGISIVGNDLSCFSGGGCTIGSNAGPSNIFTTGIRVGTISTSNGGSPLLYSATAPTISSGFGSTPSITSNNGVASFRINVGTGGAATSGVIGLPTAATGWNCVVVDMTNNTVTRMTSSTTTTATLTAAAAWAASDILLVHCFAY